MDVKTLDVETLYELLKDIKLPNYYSKINANGITIKK